MRSHLNYANVMATLGVFIALGGSSYAAVKITGKDVRNGSLSGKDIKKRSVALNRLKGTLPAGPAGPAGPQGPQGQKGDPGAPAQEGVTLLSVPASQWESSEPRLIEEPTSSEVQFKVDVGDALPPYNGSGFVQLHPQLPVANAAGRTRILAVRLCTSAVSASMALEEVFINQFRATGAVPADTVAGFTVADAPDDSVCTRYALPEPFVLEPHDFINVRMRAHWTDNATFIRITNTTIEYDRVP